MKLEKHHKLTKGYDFLQGQLQHRTFSPLFPDALYSVKIVLKIIVYQMNLNVSKSKI